MGLSRSKVKWLIAAGFVILAVSLPLIVGVVFGTGPLFHAIPFTAIGGLAAAVVLFVVYSEIARTGSVDQPRLLVEEMRERVIDGSPLWEVLLPSKVEAGRGKTITYGPYPPEECSHVLVRWFEAGWFELCGYAHDEARELVGDPSRWNEDSPDGAATLLISAEGSGHSSPEWIATGLEAIERETTTPS